MVPRDGLPQVSQFNDLMVCATLNRHPFVGFCRPSWSHFEDPGGQEWRGAPAPDPLGLCRLLGSIVPISFLGGPRQPDGLIARDRTSTGGAVTNLVGRMSRPSGLG